MASARRIRLGERDAMERGIRCPDCGVYTSFDDIIATGGCRHGTRRGGECEATLALELVVE
ncbi:MAG: hypothetical protein ABEJ85_01305 [Haloarculaceae archaeon]